MTNPQENRMDRALEKELDSACAINLMTSSAANLPARTLVTAALDRSGLDVNKNEDGILTAQNTSSAYLLLPPIPSATRAGKHRRDRYECMVMALGSPR